MKPVLIADYECVCGEGPLWHPCEKRLYWVDIPKGRLFRYEPAAAKHEQLLEGDPIGGFTFQTDGSVLLFMNRGAIRSWREGAIETLLEEMPDERETRFNDVIADAEGRVFCGTMPTKDRLGRLYCLDPDGHMVKLLDGIGCSNGMGFTPDNRAMYYTDSPTRKIYRFDYESATGKLTNQEVFVEIAEGHGQPDGMTVDVDGFVWSAIWDGGCLIRFTPDGSKDLRIEFPARKVSSVIFGGDNYDELYVTTAGGDNKSDEGEGAGALFRVSTQFRGVPEFPSRIKGPIFLPTT